MTEPTLDHTAWQPAVLGSGVSKQWPCGVSQQMAMYMIGLALAKGLAVTPMDNIEATISIVDDAIHHMMRKR